MPAEYAAMPESSRKSEKRKRRGNDYPKPNLDPITTVAILGSAQVH